MIALKRMIPLRAYRLHKRPRNGVLLFATAAASQSVIQIRGEDTRPASAEHAVLFALEAAAEDLSTGSSCHN